MSKFKPTCVVLFSGGLDSGVLATELMSAGERVLGLTAKYGTRHNRHEQLAVDRLKDYFAARYPGAFEVRRYDLEGALVHAKGPMFGDGDLPTAHFEADEQKATVVPGRNLVLIAVAASLAESVGAKRVVLGTHKGDWHVYPDCRPAFLVNVAAALQQGTDFNIRLSYPYHNLSKADVVARGMDLSFPFHLTRTCYSDWSTACGVCGSCQERLHAFKSLGIIDPLPYAGNAQIPPPNPAAGVSPPEPGISS